MTKTNPLGSTFLFSIMNMIGPRNSCVTSFYIDTVVRDHNCKEVWIPVVGEELMCQQKTWTYCIAGFLHEDFNLVNGLIREIKIREVFIALHFITCLHA